MVASDDGMSGHLILVCLYIIAECVTACPSVCNCDSKTKILSCHGWKDTSPPSVANPDRYESLDLSSGSGTKYNEAECIDLIRPKTRAGVPLPSQADADAEGDAYSEGDGALLGDALEAGRLPASWLGVGRFMFLKRLRMSGAGLRLLHKDAFRYQLKLRCVDLSRNYLRRLNLFTWQRHDELQSLILAGNKGLQIPVDSPILYSKSLRMLDLSECQLKSLHFNAFDGVPRLKKLDLSNNNFKSISSSTLFPHGLMHLNMSWNNMTYLSSEIAESIMNISEVMLNNNPWQCDCHLMETWKWIRNLTPEEVFELVCFDRFSNRSWNDVFENETCESFESTIPPLTTTEDAFTAALDTVGSTEEPEEITYDTPTEEVIYRGESNENVIIILGSGMLVTQILMYVSISLQLLGRRSESMQGRRLRSANSYSEEMVLADQGRRSD